MALGVRHDVELPRRPVVVIALEGWIDASYAGAAAAGALLEAHRLRTFVTFSGDELIDFRARRPRLRVDDGVRGALTWQEPRLVVGTDALGSGLAIALGPEPDFHWRSFAREIAGYAAELEAPLVVSLGAFPAAVPHTRPIRLAAVSADERLVHQVGFVPGSVDLPAGIADVVAADCSELGIPSVALWARVPHYLAATPFPAAALVLLEGLGSVAGLSFELGALRTRATESITRVDELIAQSAEHTEMVRQLESQPEAPGGALDEEIPSGDEIAAELERYLRGEFQ